MRKINGQHTDDIHVEDLWRHHRVDEYQNVVSKLSESTYKKTPLGRSCIRGHKLPDYMKNDQYSHGVKTTSECNSENDAKRLIYPLGDNNGSSENCCNDLRMPGIQKRRNYNWVNIDPLTTTFGVKGETGMGRGSSAGVASALQMSNDDDSKSDSDNKSSSIDCDRVFGNSTCLSNDSAADCLRHKGGDIDDLGKSLTPGFRNVETSRSFGTPSIRTDIPQYERSSVADLQNYGDDVSASYLLRPSLFSSLGLEEDEFDRPRGKEYLRNLVISCGVVKDDDEFNSIFSQVAVNDDACVSINAFVGKIRQASRI